jgi:GGDEF domain-containing protein
MAYLERSLEQEMQKGQRYDHPTSVLIVDITETQQMTEANHKKLLVSMNNFLTSKLRSVDLLSRVSKWRFVALLPETPPEGAQVAADRLNDQLVDLKAETGLAFSVNIEVIGWSGRKTPRLEDILQQVHTHDDNGQG